MERTALDGSKHHYATGSHSSYYHFHERLLKNSLASELNRDSHDVTPTRRCTERERELSVWVFESRDVQYFLFIPNQSFTTRTNIIFVHSQNNKHFPHNEKHQEHR